jgi:hypothetical protein
MLLFLGAEPVMTEWGPVVGGGSTRNRSVCHISDRQYAGTGMYSTQTHHRQIILTDAVLGRIFILLLAWMCVYKGCLDVEIIKVIAGMQLPIGAC